ncbi:MAG: hypothetical protein IPK71_03080 [Myxococcales bacterium]|nr:hypothetical protein [Myxococcales bacterium]
MDKPDRTAVLVWIRRLTYQPYRNSHPADIDKILSTALRLGHTPIVLGNSPERPLPRGATDLTEHWNEVKSFNDQLMLLRTLRQRGALLQVGVRSAALDTGAFMGIPTISIDPTPPTDRSGHLADVLPNYLEARQAEAIDAMEHLLAPSRVQIAFGWIQQELYRTVRTVQQIRRGRHLL